MATRTSAELGAVFECDGGLDDFEPEPESERGLSWRRVPSAASIDQLRWEPYVAPKTPRSWRIVVPVLMAAAIAGAALAWLALRENLLPGQPPAVATQVQPVPTEPTSPSVTELQTAVPAVETPPLESPQPPPAVSVSARSVAPALEPTLAAVSRAYRERDATQLAGVWPGADTASLEQAFTAVKYQALSFDRCATRPNGAESMTATCEVSIARAAKEGDPSLQRHRESWTLVLNRAGEGWTIAGVSARPAP